MNLIILFTFIITFSFLVRTLRNIFHLVFLWQMKEYRLDRMFAHLRTPMGRKLFLGYLPVVKWILFLGILSGAFLHGAETYFFLFWAVWFLESLLNLRELILYRWRLPQFTVKAVFILCTVFFVLFYIVFDKNTASILGKTLLLGPFIDRLSWLLVTIVIGLFGIPVIVYKKVLIYQAKKKIQKLPNIKIIGITGSYGKTSTKEFLATILSSKFKVAKTFEFTNTDVGIAKFILKDLNADDEVFVVEMGAYKKGEIKAICDIAKPQISIITGINQQHLELFGSVENIKKAKFEAVYGLESNGVAVFNGDNKHCVEMSHRAKESGIRTLVYMVSKYIKDTKIYKDHIEFDLCLNDKKYKMKVNLLGGQNLENLAGAIAVALELGLTQAQIAEGIRKIASPPKTMKLIKGPRGLTLVDDTFNANPDGVSAAASFMRTFKGKKILVLTPLIELGEEAEEIHARLGEELAKTCDLILLTNMNYNKSFIDGVGKVDTEKKVQTVNTAVGVKLIKENLDKDGVAVFEGKEAGRILEKLVKLD